MAQPKKIGVCIMSALYIVAGINHFINPMFYKKIMPPWLPVHDLLILASGICEIVLGILLIPFATRKWAAWGIIFLLIAVFPANVQMMLNYYHQQHAYLWVAFLRLPVQLLLIWWAYRYTK